MTLHLHIESIAFTGLDLTPAARHQVLYAVETELARLLTAAPITPHVAATHAHRQGRVVQLPPGGAPAELGRRLARSIYGALPR